MEAQRSDLPSEHGRTNDPPPPLSASDATLRGVVRPATDATVLGASRVRPPSATGVPSSLGHYQLLEPIGEGGMGTVFKAYHSGLDRYYALKVMRAAEGGEDRFLLEARAAARIGRHPGIVQVHDAGCEQGWRYLAMDLIDGRPLSEVIGRQPMPNRSAAEFALAIAEAVQAAHDAGVLHRDLKPSNVLVTKEGRALVADFGLARDLNAQQGLSQEGELIGTLFYMAPEQAEGQREGLGPPTDVYGIAATLYEMLTGRAPFSGATPVDVWKRVLHSEPSRPSAVNAKAHGDLETICLKGLEKDPSHRYATAGAMAEDLKRYLSGEPILARPSGPAARAWRRLKRNPLVASLSAALVVGAAVLAFAVWSIHAEKLQSAEREREAENRQRELTEGYLRDLAENGQDLLDASRARRAIGDLAGMRRIAGGVERLVASLKRSAPGLAEPWYYEGMVERALSRFDAAERSQGEAITRARAAGASEGSRAVLPLALYERGTLRVQRYQWMLEMRRQELLRSRADRPGAAPPPMPSTAEVVAAFADLQEVRALAKEDLQGSLVGAADGGAAAESARAHAARGALRLLESSDVSAEGEFQRAIEADPYLEEAHLFLGASLRNRGEFLASAEAFARAHETDRGFLPYLTGEARSLGSADAAARSRGQESGDLRKRALERVEAGLALDGRSSELWYLKSFLLGAEADVCLDRGKEYDSIVQGSLDAAHRSAEIDPRDLEAAHAEAMASWRVGWTMAKEGKDPQAMHEACAAACERALSIRPEDALAARMEAQAWLAVAEYFRRTDRDPGSWCAKAIAAAETSLRLDPLSAPALNDLSLAHQSIADWRKTHGQDPTSEYRAAASACERAIAIAPDLSALLANHAVICRALAECERARGQDPTEDYLKALAEYDRALALNPTYAPTVFNRANLLRALGAWRATHGGDWKEAFEGAIRGYLAVQKLNPKYYGIALSIAGTLFDRADLLRASGGDAEADVRKALEVCDRAIQFQEGDWQAREGRALALERLGRVAEAVAEWQEVVRRAPAEGQEAAKRELERTKGLLPPPGR